MTLENITAWFGQHPIIGQALTGAGVAFLSLAAYLVTKRFVLRALGRLSRMTKTQMDDILIQKVLRRRLSFIAALLVVYSLAHLFPHAEDIIHRISLSLIFLFALLAAGALLTELSNAYLTLDISKGRPIKGYVQVVKLIVYIAGGIVIFSSLIGRSPAVLLGGFGAMTAVLLLIFRDTILSFVASIQITSYDLMRVGDWIEVPKYGADGDVLDISLHTIKVQNWDKTFTVIPTHKVLEDTFKNWRGMQQSGGRRIKRAVHIDQNSIGFCDDELIGRLARIQLIADYVRRKQEELTVYNRENQVDMDMPANGRRMTNIGTFRAYVGAYLRSLETIHQGMTFLVRQLAPGPSGLPIEIYVFTRDTAWATYEAIQSDIFDHILAVLPEFELRLFQDPTGSDFSRLTAT
ncbi:MAG: mechanosensitive ion channel [Deltaproteobacteria bacterium]|nr:mechanosensitive ion channel [Deltaproteobacteria bacterium]MBW1817359.1 mechanosensitive ion channel [Deltaproteobacteria bacterium]